MIMESSEEQPENAGRQSEEDPLHRPDGQIVGPEDPSLPATAPATIRIMAAETEEELEQAKTLFREYASSLEFSLDFQDFEDELATFPGAYAPPSGALLLARSGTRALGCVALRKLESGVCEMKRLYVLPDRRGQGLGRMLAEAIINEGRRLGYARMRLDTAPAMTAAITLYESLGFETIGAYRHNPLAGARFMELTLSKGHSGRT
jgi:ribosomal protein S18 acetylase RimI-like enzyme